MVQVRKEEQFSSKNIHDTKKPMSEKTAYGKDRDLGSKTTGADNTGVRKEADKKW